MKFEEWTSLLPPDVKATTDHHLVHTTETLRAEYLMNLLVKGGYSVLITGDIGGYRNMAKSDTP
jgi:hypothetical protein